MNLDIKKIIYGQLQPALKSLRYPRDLFVFSTGKGTARKKWGAIVGFSFYSEHRSAPHAYLVCCLDMRDLLKSTKYLSVHRCNLLSLIRVQFVSAPLETSIFEFIHQWLKTNYLYYQIHLKKINLGFNYSIRLRRYYHGIQRSNPKNKKFINTQEFFHCPTEEL